MSESHSTTHLVRAEEDRISTRRIVAVGIASLVLFFLASLVATRMMERDRAALLPDGPPTPPSEVGRAKIGMVEQQLFGRTRTGEEWKAEQRRRLDGYGWVDRKEGLVHIPVDRAMDLMVQGERP
jgi:hypothetical protein